jgi:AraC-like DNA-binding protein
MPVTPVVLDHPNEIGALTPWQVDFRQLDPGRLHTRIAVSSGRSVSALHISMSQRVHQRGASPNGWTTVGIPLHGGIDTWQGKTLTQAALLAFGDSDGFDGVSTAAFSGNVVSFETRQLQALAQTCGFALNDNLPEARKIGSESGFANLLRLDARVSKLLHGPDMVWSAETEEALMLDALQILTDHDVHFDKSHSATRRRALNRAIDLMLNHLEEPILIEQICQDSGASWRTLDRAFKEHFDLGPKAYYMRLRLNRVREDLLQASGASITDVANRYGFWHLGQFARDYKLFFGERPSQTQTRLTRPQ